MWSYKSWLITIIVSVKGDRHPSSTSYVNYLTNFLIWISHVDILKSNLEYVIHLQNIFKQLLLDIYKYSLLTTTHFHNT